MQVARQKSDELQAMVPMSATFSDNLDPAIFGNIIDLLRSAHKPLIVIGNGCRRKADDVEALVTLTGIPFVTTPQAKGLIAEDHPMSLRNGGLAASGWARKYINEGDDVDVCLALGTDLDDCATGPTKYVRAGTKLIHVDIDPVVFSRNFKTFLPVKADLTYFLNQLIAFLRKKPVQNAQWKLMLDDIKFNSPFDAAGFQEDMSAVIKPHRAIADLQAVMPPSTRYITDIGEHMLFALHYLTILQGGHFNLHLNLGSMGSGIGGALGLALANPRLPVVCICGDGGMQMNGMEILVAKKLRLPVVYAVFNDARYNMVFHGFKMLYEYEHDWETPPIDFTAWASSIGVKSFILKRPGELSAAMIQEWLGEPGPLVLDIRIDKNVRISGAGRNEHLQHMSVQKDLMHEVDIS
jgi:acetolactate synthase-1/2/3 large subunit